MGGFGFRGGWQKKHHRAATTRHSGVRARRLRYEPLEDRHLLSVTLNPINGPDLSSAYNVPSGKDLYVPLVGHDTGQSITYTANSTNPSVQVSVLTGNPDLVFNVTGTDSNGFSFSGQLEFQLFENLAPQTVAAIIADVNSGVYTNSSFYRMETSSSFQLIQGGISDESSPPSVAPVPNEYNANIAYNTPGLLAMAATSAHVASSEFFLTGPTQPLSSEPQALNFGYTIFGQLLTGQDIYSRILNVSTHSSGGVNIANTPVTITSASIVQNDTQNGVLQISEPAGFTGSAAITVTGTGSDNTSAQQSFNVNVITPVPPAQEPQVLLGPVSNLTTSAGKAVQFQITATDTNGGTPTFSISDQNPFGQPPYSTPANVTVTVTPGTNDTATVTLTPKAGFTGTLQLVAHADDASNGLRDAQAFTLTVGGPLTVQTPGTTQQVAAGSVLSVTGVSLTDPALPTTSNITATFAALNGTINLSTTIAAGITSSQVSSNGTGFVTITAPLAAINATLAATGGLIYAPNTGFGGADTLSINASDSLGNTSTGSVPLSVVASLLISAPTTTLATPQNTSLAVSGISVTDPGLPAADNITFLLTTSHGTVTLATNVSSSIAAAQVIGNGTAQVIVTAPLAAINATLAAANGVVYTPATGFNGSDGVMLDATDPLGNSIYTSVAIAVGLTITAPTTTEVPSAASARITGVAISDPALPGADTLTLTIAAQHGNVKLAIVTGGVSASEITNNNTASVTVTGTLAQINTTLAATNGLIYRSANDYDGSDTLSLTATDQLTSTATNSVSLLVVGPLTVVPPIGGIVGAGAPIPLTGMVIVDPALPSTDNISLVLNAANSTLALNTTVIGGLTDAQITGNGTNSVTVTAPLSAINATLAATNGLLYIPTFGFAGTDTLTFTATDTAGNSDIEQTQFTVLGPLSLSLPTFEQFVTAGGSTAISGISVSDPGLSSLAPVTMTLQANHGVLNLSTFVTNGLIASQITGNGTSSITITAPIAAINSTLADANGLTYSTDSDFSGNDEINVSVTDPANNAAYGAIPIGAASSINVPVSLAVPMNQTTAVNGISIQDPSLSSFNDLTVTFYVQDGYLTLSTTVPNGIAWYQVYGSGSSYVSVTASLAQINATLAADGGLTYTPYNGFTGNDFLSVTANDFQGTYLNATTTLNVIAPLSITTPSSPPIVAAHGQITITGASLSNPAAPSTANVVTTFSVEHGTLLLSTNVPGGLTAAQILGNGTNLVTILAPVSAINATLADTHGLTYRVDSGYLGTDNLSITAEDTLQHTASANVAISVVGPLSITVNSTTQLVEANSLANFYASLNDPGLPSDSLVTVSLTAAHGAIDIVALPFSYGGLTTNQVTGNGTSSVVIVATLAEINYSLQYYSSSYLPEAGYNGPDAVTITATDQAGNTNTASVGLTVIGPLTIQVPPSSPPLNATGPLSISGVSLTDQCLPATSLISLNVYAGSGGVYLATNVPGGLTSAEIWGNGSPYVTVTATLAEINTTLAATHSVSYVPFQGYNGLDNVTFSAWDGLVGSGFQTIAIQVLPPPEVTGVLVDSTSWSQSYLQQLASNGQSSGGYSIPTGAAQTRDLPWSNLNQIQIVFNRDVNVQQNSLLLTDKLGVQYLIRGFTYNPSTYTAVWTLGGSIGADNMQIHLSSTGPYAVTDRSGNSLDGDWRDGLQFFPSGDGLAGGNFDFSFNVLPGDINQDGIVNAQDTALASSSWLKANWRADFNGDGIVNVLEMAMISSAWLSSLPANGAPANATVATSALSVAATPPASVTPSQAPVVPAGTVSPTTATASGLTAPAVLGPSPTDETVVDPASASEKVTSAVDASTGISAGPVEVASTSVVDSASSTVGGVTTATNTSLPATSVSVDRPTSSPTKLAINVAAPIVDHIMAASPDTGALSSSLLSVAARIERSLSGSTNSNEGSNDSLGTNDFESSAIESELATLLAKNAAK
ncbi:MAG TPA: peptidylprolyl isomerase [Pirellulales bacterium]|jgi:cyclophilin family peptidyl-prolyl cis-trans isomerase